MESVTEKYPLLIILSGPSGVGKDTVLTGMKAQGYPLYYVVTLTTRAQREGEKDGVDYHFTTRAKFEEMIENEELLEWANVYGNLYGVPRQEVKQALARGQDTIIRIDVQGSATIKSILPQAVFIFLASPSMLELENRLKQRATESSVDLKMRMKAVHEEMDSLSIFDYIVINYRDKLELAISQITAIITAEKCRVNPRAVVL
ncbi:guanylate kinase [Chloroflexota bacterium]